MPEIGMTFSNTQDALGDVEITITVHDLHELLIKAVRETAKEPRSDAHDLAGRILDDAMRANNAAEYVEDWRD